jgi:hypothetical protein
LSRNPPPSPISWRSIASAAHEARRFFRAAPPSCIEFDADGMAMLCEKFYEYWPNRGPEEATTWRVISRHQNLEEAERRMRLIIGGPLTYSVRAACRSLAGSLSRQISIAAPVA